MEFVIVLYVFSTLMIKSSRYSFLIKDSCSVLIELIKEAPFFDNANSETLSIDEEYFSLYESINASFFKLTKTTNSSLSK